jgi:hypothetical protein
MPCHDLPSAHLRRRLKTIWLPIALSLALTPTLLIPTTAPAAQRHAKASGETGTTPPAESGTSTSGEAGALPPAETITAPPAETTVAPPREPREPGAPRASRNGERRASRGAGACHLKIAVNPRRLTSGESATVSGGLICPLSSDAGEQTVTVYQHVAGTPGYGVLGTTTSEADGSYQLTTEPLDTNSTFYAAARGVRSGRRVAKVAPRVSIAGPPDGAQLLIAGRRSHASVLASDNHSSNTVTFTGTVSPNDAGARVVLQRDGGAASGDWRRIGLGAVGSDGKYSLTHTFGKPGHASVRVVVRARGRNLAGASEPLSYEISQPQNPLLTIRASANPIAYGQSVVISGTAAGSANEPLTLLAHTRGNAFAEVAKVTTDANGDYTFPAQSPTRSTCYRVKGSHADSSMLFEGVSSLITANVSATSVQAGQPLTFSGTLTPSHVGQVVYLQRQNPSGIGYHTVETGAVGADSSFSIDHIIFSAGTQVFRIKTPGGPDSQATASELFTIGVSAAAAGTLTAAAPEAEPARSQEPA